MFQWVITIRLEINEKIENLSNEIENIKVIKRKLITEKYNKWNLKEQNKTFTRWEIGDGRERNGWTLRQINKCYPIW